MDMALARADNTEQRFYSMTAQIHVDRTQYYDLLESTQKSGMDVTDWLLWFVARLEAALASAEDVIDIVHRKQRFWDDHRDSGLNARQMNIVNMLFDGFVAKLKRAKYAKINKCSEDTALRDLADLVGRGILIQVGVGAVRAMS